MSTATLNAPTATAAATATATGPRHDMYASIHKALRSFMLDTLARVGRLDVFDAREIDATLGQLDALLELCTQHLRHENEFVHPAIEARQPGGAGRIGAEHDEHLESIATLHDEARRLREAADGQRIALSLRLYRHLALFVAENFQHMHLEETMHNAALWAHYSDADLHEVHDRLMASLPPHEVLEVARWMVPALSPLERAGQLNGLKAGLPAPAFEALIDCVRPHLDAVAWAKLAPAIGMR